MDKSVLESTSEEKAKRIIVMDMEMTATTPENSLILEIFAKRIIYPVSLPIHGTSTEKEPDKSVLSDDKADPESFHAVIHHDAAKLKQHLSEWSASTHGGSGLLYDVERSKRSSDSVDKDLSTWVAKNRSSDDGSHSVIAGNSIWCDLAFLRTRMPLTAQQLFSLPTLDLTSLLIATEEFHWLPREAILQTSLSVHTHLPNAPCIHRNESKEGKGEFIVACDRPSLLDYIATNSMRVGHHRAKPDVDRCAERIAHFRSFFLSASRLSISLSQKMIQRSLNVPRFRRSFFPSHSLRSQSSTTSLSSLTTTLIDQGKNDTSLIDTSSSSSSSVALATLPVHTPSAPTKHLSKAFKRRARLHKLALFT